MEKGQSSCFGRLQEMGWCSRWWREANGSCSDFARVLENLNEGKTVFVSSFLKWYH